MDVLAAPFGAEVLDRVALCFVFNDVLGATHVSIIDGNAVHEVDAIALILKHTCTIHSIQWRPLQMLDLLVIQDFDTAFQMDLRILLDPQGSLPHFLAVQIRLGWILQIEAGLDGLAPSFCEVLGQDSGDRRLHGLQSRVMSLFAGPCLHINRDALSRGRVRAQCVVGCLVNYLSRFRQRWIMGLIDRSRPKSVRILLIPLILQHFILDESKINLF